MALPLLLAAPLILQGISTVGGLVQTSIMQAQLDKQNKQQSEMLKGMLGQGNQQMAMIGGLTGQGMPGQQMPGLA